MSVFRVIDTHMIHYDTDGYIAIPQRYRIVSIVSIVYGYGVILTINLIGWGPMYFRCLLSGNRVSHRTVTLSAPIRLRGSV